MPRPRLERLARSIAGKGSEDFELAVFYGADSRAEDILEQLECDHALAKRVVVVRAAEEAAPVDARSGAVSGEPVPQTSLCSPPEIDQRKTFWKNAWRARLSYVHPRPMNRATSEMC
jgi:hypothetical protein